MRVSVDGRRRFMDKIFIERRWRSLKYEAVYLHELEDGLAARRVVRDWIASYNDERPCSALERSKRHAQRRQAVPSCPDNGSRGSKWHPGRARPEGSDRVAK